MKKPRLRFTRNAVEQAKAFNKLLPETTRLRLEISGVMYVFLKSEKQKNDFRLIFDGLEMFIYLDNTASLLVEEIGQKNFYIDHTIENQFILVIKSEEYEIIPIGKNSGAIMLRDYEDLAV